MKTKLYSETHEWISLDTNANNDKQVATVGLSKHAQTLLGELVYVELPEIGALLERDTPAGVVESVKSASDYYAPVSGIVTQVNESLIENPKLINEKPENDGWLFQIEITDASEIDHLMLESVYKSKI